MPTSTCYLVNSTKKQFVKIIEYSQESVYKFMLLMESQQKWNLGRDYIWIQQDNKDGTFKQEFINGKLKYILPK